MAINDSSPSTGSVLNRLMTGGKDKMHTWEELSAIEKRRRALLTKTDLSIIRIMLSWDGTVLQALIRDSLLWCTLLIYVVMRVLARTDHLGSLTDVGVVDISLLGGFLTFFLVFYVLVSNNRFGEQYGCSMSAEARIFDAAALARATLPRDRALRLVRHMNAMMTASYVGLSGTYSTDNFFAVMNRNHRLLTDKEMERVRRIDMDSGCSAYSEIAVWACADVADAEAKNLIDQDAAWQFRDLILQLRGSLSTLYDFDDQPVCFFYIHFICLLTALYLPLFALTSGMDSESGSGGNTFHDILTGLIVLFQAVQVIGLRLLAVEMADPYGYDVTDLSVIHYSNYTWLASRRMLNADLAQQKYPSSPQEEEELASKSQDIGEAFNEWDGVNIFKESEEKAV